MAFVRLAFFPGATVGQYEALRAALVEAGAPTPPSRLLFAAGARDGGLQVVQVWESQEALHSFNYHWLIPVAATLAPHGFPAPPEVVDYETHDLQLSPRRVHEGHQPDGSDAASSMDDH